MKTFAKTIILLSLFSIAMGYLETAVVVYLRELLYSGGFSFPVQPASRIVIITELGRELATVVMLLTIGILTGKTFAQRFAFFIYCFAVWDIFYYIFLKVLLDWPATIFDWDILFLLPVPWVGPVLAPCLISCTMIAFTFMVAWLESKEGAARLKWHAWLFMTLGCLVLVASFCSGFISIFFR